MGTLCARCECFIQSSPKSWQMFLFKKKLRKENGMHGPRIQIAAKKNINLKQVQKKHESTDEKKKFMGL